MRNLHASLLLTCAVLLACAASPPAPTNLSSALDADARTLKQLEEAGADLSKPHVVEFFLYFPSQRAAEAAAEEIRSLGYAPEVGLPPDSASWLCFAQKQLVPSYEAIAATTEELTRVATNYGGVYDGWGTQVVL